MSLSNRNLIGNPMDNGFGKNGKLLLEVRDVVKHYPVTGGVFLRRIASVKAVDGVSLGDRKSTRLNSSHR